jgi:GT2 family glycosyltransferase
MKISIGIATHGRPSVLLETIRDLFLQVRMPDSILVVYAEETDVELSRQHFPGVNFNRTELGLTRQRNVILDLSCDCDLLLFLDDDFHVEQRYLEVMEELFTKNAGVVVATGRLLADGINGPGISSLEARRVIANRAHSTPRNGGCQTVFNAYGCNMCVRMNPIKENGLRFDEELPFYGWYEDVDFSRQMARFGSVVRAEGAVGVHLGTKSGRTSGVRLGYSQVANPIYLMRKGTFPLLQGVYSIAVRFAKNVVLSFAPEPYVDRRGRFRGNLLGFWDCLRRRLSPGRILDL